MSNKKSSKSSSSKKAPAKSAGKPMAIVVGGVVIAVVLAVVLVQSGAEEPIAGSTASLEDAAARHVRGADAATVTLVEFADFQCPTCGAYHPVLKALLERFPDDLEIEFRHFPLVSIHPNAMPAAIAAEAAGLQERFWEMNDLLFEKQAAWSLLADPQPAFTAYAETLALDVDQFQRDLRSEQVQQRVLVDARLANEMRLPGTPSFFVNDRQIPLPSNLTEFERIILDAIENQ